MKGQSMLVSFSEFKFFQSFRVPVEQADDLRFMVSYENELGQEVYINDAILKDISVTGLGFITNERIAVGDELNISLQLRKVHLDLTGSVVRAFPSGVDDDSIIYGVELDTEHKMKKFLGQYISSFSVERLKDTLTDMVVKERYTKATDGFEMFSLLLSLFKDITHFGDKDGFLDSMVEEVVRILNGQRASIFLINPETNELEAISALGVKKDGFKFDYRLGIAGCVFTTGVALNIDINKDSTRFNNQFDEIFGFKTKSIICHPIHNGEDKIIGVIEVINKRNEDRFTVDDEKTMKVLALVFSAVFHNYNPISEISQIRRFSTPFDRKNAIIGKTAHVNSLRNTIIKTKDLDAPVLIHGENGVGKKLLANIIHQEGNRGLKPFDIVDCSEKKSAKLNQALWGENIEDSRFITCQGGTLFLHELNLLDLTTQEKIIQTLKHRRVPGSKISLDVRIVASSSEDLGSLVAQGLFNQELYEYISRIYINIDPLRRRSGDIPDLVDYFLKIECQKQGLLLKTFSQKAMDKLVSYDWPGNIQELKLCIERAVLYNPKSHIIPNVDLENSATPLLDINIKKRMFGNLPHVGDFNINLKDRVAIVEREMILAEIKRNNGNKSKAAKSMGISREALRKKLLISSKIMDHLEKTSNIEFTESLEELKDVA